MGLVYRVQNVGIKVSFLVVVSEKKVDFFEFFGSDVLETAQPRAHQSHHRARPPCQACLDPIRKLASINLERLGTTEPPILNGVHHSRIDRTRIDSDRLRSTRSGAARHCSGCSGRVVPRVAPSRSESLQVAPSRSESLRVAPSLSESL